MNKPRDIIIERVIQKFKSRSEVGFKKYGVTLKDDDQPLDVWLTHIQEELMDAVNYIEKAKDVLKNDQYFNYISNNCYIRNKSTI